MSFDPTGYERWHEKWTHQSRAATDLIMRGAGISPGMSVLDLACGGGVPALEIAKAVRPGGRVVAVDVDKEMLRVGRENSVKAGLSNVDFRLADAKDLFFPDESFDAVTCRFGIMYFTDPDAVMKRVHRILKPRGRACVVAWGPLRGNPRFQSTYGVVLNSLGMKLESYHLETFRFDRPRLLSAVMAKAGFREISANYRRIPFAWDGPPCESFECFHDISGQFRSLFERLPARSKERVKGRIIASMAKYYDGEKVNFTAKVVFAVCRR
jgi:ubiquinone/menaquinone biosynthesis C-methylase UbiE